MIKYTINVLLVLIITFMTTALFAKEHKERRGHKRNGKMMMKHLDKNKDDKISKEEFLAKFQEMDGNSDGYLTIDEIKNHHKKMRKNRRGKREEAGDDED